MLSKSNRLIKANTLLVFALIFGVTVLLSLNRHSKSGLFNYHSEIWSDKAGYNVYLPALFIYRFDGYAFPDSIAVRTGDGFSIDQQTGKVRTKYPYGVALLQSPFWLLAHWFSESKSGFDEAYHKATNFSAAFYFTLGLFFIYKRLYISTKPLIWVWITMIFTAFGTSVFYYTIFESGMSHVYSFSLFSILIYTLNKPERYTKLVICLLLITVVRPANLIFAGIIVIGHFNANAGLIATIKPTLAGVEKFKWLFISALFLSPFLWYQRYLGTTATNLYPNEGFSFWTNPKLSEVMFAPNNGLFLYTPLLFIVLIFSLEKWRDGLLLWVISGVYILFYGSWWSYYLGCGFGHRGFTDITPIFAVFLHQVLMNTKYKAILIAASTIACLFTLKMMFSYDGCYQGVGDWDWSFFYQLLNNPIR